MANVRLSKKPLKRVFIKHIPQAVPVKVYAPVRKIPSPSIETKETVIEAVVETPIVEVQETTVVEDIKPVKKTRKSKKNTVQEEQNEQ